jgi:hypothetical protein
MSVISKGITLAYSNGTTAEFKELTGLQEIPELNGDVDSIEITTLADDSHRYTSGLKNYGDNLAFKFVYEKAQFLELNGLEGSVNWKVEFPDGSSFTFGGTCSVKTDGAGVGALITYTLNIKPDTEIVAA